MKINNKLIKIQKKVNLVKEITDGLHYVLSKKNNSKYINELNDMFKIKLQQVGGSFKDSPHVGIDKENDITYIFNPRKFIDLYDMTFEQIRKDYVDDKNFLYNYGIYLNKKSTTDEEILSDIKIKRDKYIRFINSLQNNKPSMDEVNKMDELNKYINTTDIDIYYLKQAFLQKAFEKIKHKSTQNLYTTSSRQVAQQNISDKEKILAIKDIINEINKIFNKFNPDDIKELKEAIAFLKNYIYKYNKILDEILVIMEKNKLVLQDKNK